MERLWIAADVKGPAWIVVPISEVEHDRWMFNDAVALILGRDVQSIDELLLVSNFVGRMTDRIDHADMIRGGRQAAWEYHKKLIERILHAYPMTPEARAILPPGSSVG